MFKMRKHDETPLEKEIAAMHETLEELEKGSEDYTAAAKQLEILYRIQRESEQGIDPNTALVVAANLVGVLLVVRREEFNVVTSKAMGMIMRPRA